ncbi:hypothetical protein [Flavobacterium sp.]|jgi:hypothetical protein|uniref:hypothetical protein n=1 Tax=Flavobacterium sp. TaxID=239 RepID=UPI0037BE8EF7
MKDKIKLEIEKWENQTIKLTNQFLYDYFDDVDPYYFYVADEIGGVFSYGDYWFNFSDILVCYKLGITEEQLLNWYDFCLSNHSVNISLARFILSPEERKQAEEKHLAELKERVKSAEKTLKEALEQYGK